LRVLDYKVYGVYLVLVFHAKGIKIRVAVSRNVLRESCINIPGHSAIVKVREVRANFFNNLNVKWHLVAIESEDLRTRIHAALRNLPTKRSIKTILIMAKRSAEKNRNNTIHFFPSVGENGRMTTTIYVEILKGYTRHYDSLVV
jgi:hypothetical protein